MNKLITAIIPARGGSKGVPGKNIRNLQGFPLIAYSITAAKLSKKIQRIIVSTDSEEIASMCRKYGAEVPFLRPPELAMDNSTDKDFMDHAINWFDNNEVNTPDYWVHLRPTTPLRDPGIVDDAIISMINSDDATSLRSAHPAPESPFKWFVRNKNGYFHSIIDSLNNERINDPRQGFPDVFVPDGYVDVLSTSFIKKSNLLHGDKMIGYISPPCKEVDTLEDFEYLEFEIQKKGSILYEYLRKNKD
jgi:CMP-N,N'-diacetyllegionaminic acid synthase